MCTEETLMDPVMLAWADRIRAAWDRTNTGAPVLTHRKIWEWVFIIEALHERGMLGHGRRGLGFGVGQDPLAALFASLGCRIVATDIGADRAGAGWVESGQHAAGVDALNRDGICDPADFEERVTFRTVDMRAIPADLLRGEFDFAWSACALEHLGSLAAGQEFLLRQMDCLRPRGVAVHTTEFNVGSDRDTVGVGDTVLYRRRDVEYLAAALRSLGHGIELDFDPGSTPADRHVDTPPWGGPHLKIQLERFVTTSLGIIVEKSAADDAPSWHPDRRWAARAAALSGAFRVSSFVRSAVGRLGRRVSAGSRRAARDAGPPVGREGPG